MNTDRLLDLIFRLARRAPVSAIAEMPYGLETAVLAHWYEAVGNRSANAGLLRGLRWAALAACAVCVGAYVPDLRPLDQQTAGNPLNFLNGTLPEPNWTLFKQCGQSWSGARIGTCTQTICDVGCAMSSVAMMLNTKGVNVDPGSFNTWNQHNGGYASGCDIIWQKSDAFGKTKYQGKQKASEAELCAGIAANHGIIANVRNGQHWVLLTGCKGGGVFTVNDPGFNQATYTLGQIVEEAVYH